MVSGTYNYSYWGESKPTYNWGASHCRIEFDSVCGPMKRDYLCGCNLPFFFIGLLQLTIFVGKPFAGHWTRSISASVIMDGRVVPKWCPCLISLVYSGTGISNAPKMCRNRNHLQVHFCPTSVRYTSIWCMEFHFSCSHGRVFHASKVLPENRSEEQWVRVPTCVISMGSQRETQKIILQQLLLKLNVGLPGKTLERWQLGSGFGQAVACPWLGWYNICNILSTLRKAVLYPDISSNCQWCEVKDATGEVDILGNCQFLRWWNAKTAASRSYGRPFVPKWVMSCPKVAGPDRWPMAPIERVSYRVAT